MECKFAGSNGRPLRTGRLNRNILECKSNMFYIVNYSSTGLNRNILECKSTGSAAAGDIDVVLIETYWNVNLGISHGAYSVLSS